MEEKIAASIYLLNPQLDQKQMLLEILTRSNGHDLDKILAIYKKIASRGLLVAHISTSVEIDKNSKDKIESFIKLKYTSKELIFFYEINPTVKNGIAVKVGDDEIEFSVK